MNEEAMKKIGRERAEITAADVVNLARLARIAITDADQERLPEELSRIAAYARQLEAVDVAGVTPMVHASGAVLRLRADEALSAPVLAGRRAVRMSEGYDDDGLRVPKVVE